MNAEVALVGIGRLR